MADGCTSCGGVGTYSWGGTCVHCYGIGRIPPKAKEMKLFMQALEEHMREYLSTDENSSPSRTRDVVMNKLAKLLSPGDA
jgi:DnaJ-class molecular chaperone